MQFIDCNFGDFRGKIDSNYRELVDRWLTGRADTCVMKQKPYRNVWLIDERIVVKEFSKNRWLARKEFESLVKLESRGINVAHPVGYIYREKSGYLITEYIENACSLFNYLKDFGGCKDTLLKSLSDFLKTIISTNLATPDFHAGNILVKEANNDFVFYLIDVHRCKFTRTTSYAHIIYMLSFFIHSIYQNFQTSQLVRFIKNCLPEDTDLANTCRIILNQFRKIYHRHRTRRTLRCLHNNPDFCVIKEDAKYFLPSSASLETMKNILRELPGYQVVKRVKNRTIYVNNTYFIKEIASGRQAILSWINHNGLIFRGISTPCCLGAILKGNKGYLVFKFLHNTLPLYEFIKENPSQVDRDFIKKLAGFIRNMHLAGVFHKDLKANNILVSKGKDIYIVDIDQVRFVKGVSLAKIIKNLAQLNAGVGSPVCITDRIRFYNFYAGLDFRLNKERKKIIAQIMRITRKRKHVWP